MTETKRTPRTFKVAPLVALNDPRPQWVITDGKWGSPAIAIVYSSEEDAIRMAASLEMLEALKDLAFAAAAVENTAGDPCHYLECKANLRAATARARAAVSKAIIKE